MKLGVNLEDEIAFEALLQLSQMEIQELRHKLNMLGGEQVQTKELVHVEEEKKILAKELIDMNNRIVALKQ